jgi:enoyl-[acyl-carrier-protein] reductase (NADH)
MGEAQDIANAALYLASQDGRLVTGVALAVDAGLDSVMFR